MENTVVRRLSSADINILRSVRRGEPVDTPLHLWMADLVWIVERYKRIELSPSGAAALSDADQGRHH
jgi:hypothetical protein